MATVPAVCPACAKVHALDVEHLPETLTCACGAELVPTRYEAAVMLHKPRARAAAPAERPEVAALVAQADATKHPKKQYDLLQKAAALDPDSFLANRALLYHGRLHECVQRPGDFSCIKCHLLDMYHAPASYTDAQLEAMVTELFADPLLARTLALSGDAEGCLHEYLLQLARGYVSLFLRGRSDVSRTFLGFSRPQSEVQDWCAHAVADMRAAVREDARLEEPQRGQLLHALEVAFVLDFPGQAEALRAAEQARAAQPQPAARPPKRRRFFS